MPLPFLETSRSRAPLPSPRQHSVISVFYPYLYIHVCVCCLRVIADVRFIEETCRSAGVHNAFHLRRELVNLKKVCQHILEDAKQTERELKQLTTFYYNDIVQTDREGFYHSKRYADISDKMKQCQGSTQTILDMRGFLKAICCVPRHADGDRPCLLANLPFSLKSYKMLSHCEAYANGLCEEAQTAKR